MQKPKTDLKAKFKALPAGKKKSIIKEFRGKFDRSLRTFYERIRGTYKNVYQEELDYLNELITQ